MPIELLLNEISLELILLVLILLVLILLALENNVSLFVKKLHGASVLYHYYIYFQVSHKY